MDRIEGLHHVTAISGPAQPTVDFFCTVLGQRLVKRTVNFDAPTVYHLYFGDSHGAPGSIVTFFPRPDRRSGRAGPGMASAWALGVPRPAFDRLAQRAAWRGRRFGEDVAILNDPDGAPVEIVAAPADAVIALHSVTLCVADPAPTAALLRDVFGYADAGVEQGADGDRPRLVLPGTAPGRAVDILRADPQVSGAGGVGTIHHVAFRARDDAHQALLRERLRAQGIETTDVRDRTYFRAIYFREPGGVLFEIATDPPGFAVDEAPEALGRSLKLPPQYEARRSELEAALPPLSVPDPVAP